MGKCSSIVCKYQPLMCHVISRCLRGKNCSNFNLLSDYLMYMPCGSFITVFFVLYDAIVMQSKKQERMFIKYSDMGEEMKLRYMCSCVVSMIFHNKMLSHSVISLLSLTRESYTPHTYI